MKAEQIRNAAALATQEVTRLLNQETVEFAQVVATTQLMQAVAELAAQMSDAAEKRSRTEKLRSMENFMTKGAADATDSERLPVHQVTIPEDTTPAVKKAMDRFNKRMRELCES